MKSKIAPIQISLGMNGGGSTRDGISPKNNIQGLRVVDSKLLTKKGIGGGDQIDQMILKNVQNVQSPVNHSRQLGLSVLQSSSKPEAKKGMQKAHNTLHHSEEIQSLLESAAFEQNVELCEVISIIGASDETLKKVVLDLELPQQKEKRDLTKSLSQETLIENSYYFVDNGKQGRRDSLLGGRRQSSMNESSGTVKCKACILDSYPKIFQEASDSSSQLNLQQTQKQKQIKEKYLYLSTIQLICFPDGYFVDTEVNLSKFLSSITSTKHPFKILHYTITQSNGERKFLTCLEYSELCLVRVNITESSGQTENVLASTAQLPISITYEVKKLCLVPRAICVVSRLPSFSVQRQMLEVLYNELIKKFYTVLNEQQKQNPALQGQSYSLDIIEEEIINAKKEAKFELLEFYLSLYLNHLRIDATHFELGLFKKQSKLSTTSDQKEVLIRYANNYERNFGSLRLENYDYRMLFIRVRPHMLMQIFVSLLHERKIILILGGGSDASTGMSPEEDCRRNGAIIIETLLSLLYPLQWNFTNISCLIPSMIDYLDAPFPYIVCVSRDLWRHIYEHRWQSEHCPLGDEVVAFDLDAERVHIKGFQGGGVSQESQLPEFPQPYTQLLIKQLEKQLQKAKELQRTMPTPASIGEANEKLRVEQVQAEEIFWKQFTLKVKQQFLNFLIFLINTFENFYNNSQNQVSSSQDNDTPAAYGTNMSTLPHRGNSANDIFNFSDYVQNVRENQPFFERFVRTQAFINFIEQAHSATTISEANNNSKHDSQQNQICDPQLAFFKECTRMLSQDSIIAVRSKQDAIINSILNKCNNQPISYSVDKCYKIYESSLRAIASQINQPQSIATPQNESIYLISSFNHEKIIDMKAFDPKPLLERMLHRPPAIQMSTKLNISKKNYAGQQLPKKINVQLTMNDLSATSFQEQSKKKIFDIVETDKQENRDSGYQPQLSIEQHNGIISPSALKNERFVNEDQHYYDNSGEEAEEDEDDDPIDGQEEQQPGSSSGILGFFKKTFSSVKKTFESTFNHQKRNDEEHHSNQRASTRPRSKLVGRHTPLLDQVDFDQKHRMSDILGDNSPMDKNQNRRVRYEGSKQEQQIQVNRTTRSQTFHVSLIAKNNILEAQQNQQVVKEPESFFANLLSMTTHIVGGNSSTGKKLTSRRQDILVDPTKHRSPLRNNKDQETLLPENYRQTFLNSTVQAKGRHKLNSSGFFVFDEEDMKKMTEMSPKDVTTKNVETNQVKASSLTFDLNTIDDVNRQQPVIKGQSIFTTGQTNQKPNFMPSTSYLSNRVRSISYQQANNNQSTVRFQLGADNTNRCRNDMPLKTKENQRKLVDESLSFIDKYPQAQNKTSLRTPALGAGERQLQGNSGGANTISCSQSKSEVRKDPIRMDFQGKSQQKSSLYQKQNLLFNANKQSQRVYQKHLSLIKEDNTSIITETVVGASGLEQNSIYGKTGNYSTNNNNGKNLKIDPEFEEVYKKSTENLYFQTASKIDVASNSAEELKKGDINMKTNSRKTQEGSSNLASVLSKPPKHNQQTSSLQAFPISISGQVVTKKKKNQPPFKEGLRKEEGKTSENSKTQAYQSQSQRAAGAQVSKRQQLQYGEEFGCQINNVQPAAGKHDSIVFSEDGRTSTDDDLRAAPILGKNLAQFRNMMMVNRSRPPFERNYKAVINGLNSSQTIKPSTLLGNFKDSSSPLVSHNNMASNHRRQISESLAGTSGGGFIQSHLQKQHQLLTATHENIDPDEDEKENDTLIIGQDQYGNDYQNSSDMNQSRLHNNKQIESMQVGRLRKKSTHQQQLSGNQHQLLSKKLSTSTAPILQNITKLDLLNSVSRSPDHQGQSNSQKAISTTKMLAGSNFKMNPAVSKSGEHHIKNAKATMGKVKVENMASLQIQEQDNDDELFEQQEHSSPQLDRSPSARQSLHHTNNHTRLNYKLIQAKTVESSSNSSDQSSNNIIGSLDYLGGVLVPPLQNSIPQKQVQRTEIYNTSNFNHDRAKEEENLKQQQRMDSSQAVRIEGIVHNEFYDRQQNKSDTFIGIANSKPLDTARHVPQLIMDNTVSMQGATSRKVTNKDSSTSTVVQGLPPPPSTALAQLSQLRVHSLSQYAELPSHLHQRGDQHNKNHQTEKLTSPVTLTLQRGPSKPQIFSHLLDLSHTTKYSIQAAAQTAMFAGLNSTLHQQQQPQPLASSSKQNLGGAATGQHHNMIKPLNKITWDSFSQIAKLSGDVDHEPSTPRSGGGIDLGCHSGGGSSDDAGAYDIE